jgi:hypothetical protein
MQKKDRKYKEECQVNRRKLRSEGCGGVEYREGNMIAEAAHGAGLARHLTSQVTHACWECVRVCCVCVMVCVCVGVVVLACASVLWCARVPVSVSESVNVSVWCMTWFVHTSS